MQEVGRHWGGQPAGCMPRVAQSVPVRGRSRRGQAGLPQVGQGEESRAGGGKGGAESRVADQAKEQRAKEQVGHGKGIGVALRERAES